MTIPVIAIVGTSNSGKTRVATALIQRLVARGYRVAAVKHCPHGHQVDSPGTDSARLFGAGATRVLVSSPGQLTGIERTAGDTALEALVAALDPTYDLVIAEGFKASAAPKVLVLGEEEIKPPPQNVIAVVGQGGSAKGPVPRYSLQQMDTLAEHVEKALLAEASPAPISVLVDGAPLTLGPFPARALAAILRSFLSTLKEMPPKPGAVRVLLQAGKAGSGSPRPSMRRKSQAAGKARDRTGPPQ